MTQGQERAPIFAMLMGGAGTLLAALLVAGFAVLTTNMLSPELKTSDANAAPEALGTLVGEIVVLNVIAGIWTVAPSLLIAIALMVLKLRQRWFYCSTCTLGALFVFLVPIGTVCSLVLLIAASRRRREFFAPAAVLTPSLPLSPL